MEGTLRIVGYLVCRKCQDLWEGRRNVSFIGICPSYPRPEHVCAVHDRNFVNDPDIFEAAAAAVTAKFFVANCCCCCCCGGGDITNN